MTLHMLRGRRGACQTKSFSPIHLVSENISKPPGVKYSNPLPLCRLDLANHMIKVHRRGTLSDLIAGDEPGKQD